MEGSELNILKILLESGWVVKFVLLLLVLSSVVSWAIIFLKRSMFKEFGKIIKNFGIFTAKVKV